MLLTINMFDTVSSYPIEITQVVIDQNYPLSLRVPDSHALLYLSPGLSLSQGRS